MSLWRSAAQDAAAVLSKRPDREDVPVLGVGDGAVSGEDADDLLWHKIPAVMNKQTQTEQRPNAGLPVS